MKIIKKIVYVVVILLIILQFFRPEKNLGNYETIAAFEKETEPSDEVKLILKQACYDCHSDVTHYPWYNSITPINYWLAHHVEDGKKHFDVSKWSEYSTKKKDHKLEELIEMVENKSMPINSYTWTHKEAKLSDAQIEMLVEWAKMVRKDYNL